MSNFCFGPRTGINCQTGCSAARNSLLFRYRNGLYFFIGSKKSSTIHKQVGLDKNLDLSESRYKSLMPLLKKIITKYLYLKIIPPKGGIVCFYYDCRNYMMFSIIPAIPCPPPTQAVTMPYFLLRRFISFVICIVSFAPVHPNGWPNAIAPPLIFTMSGFRFS